MDSERMENKITAKKRIESKQLRKLYLILIVLFLVSAISYLLSSPIPDYERNIFSSIFGATALPLFIFIGYVICYTFYFRKIEE